MYTRKDLLRLQQILFLKSLGFPLGEIGSKILNENSSANLEKSFTRQREILLQQMKNLQKIVDTLGIAVDDARPRDQPRKVDDHSGSDEGGQNLHLHRALFQR